MRKSTKLITTAVALILVISAMVVGIYAATSAAASIGATVSWSAQAGMNLTVNGWTYFSKEHYTKGGNSFSTLSNHRMETISIDTTTTNQAATGMQRGLNANFIDDSDDGVNNPRTIYYCYSFWNTSSYEGDAFTWEEGQDGFITQIKCTLTKYPVSDENVIVEYWGGENAGRTIAYDGGIVFDERGYCHTAMYNYPGETFYDEDMEETIEYNHIYDEEPFETEIIIENSATGIPAETVLIFRLTLKNPNVSLTNFDASIGFNFECKKVTLSDFSGNGIEW